MVEVKDISLIPKVVQCSYKAITDNKYRFYKVNVIPSATCLPVSQWTEENYRMYGEEGGPRVSEEEGWAFDGGAAREEEAGRRARNAAEAQGAGPGGGDVNAPMNAEEDAAMHEEALLRAGEAGHVGNVQVHSEGAHPGYPFLCILIRTYMHPHSHSSDTWGMSEGAHPGYPFSSSPEPGPFSGSGS